MLTLPPPDSDPNMGKIVAVTSGKGGVGKTTSAASFAMGMAAKNPDVKVCVVDFDIGLRNLDIHLGAERRVIFDFINLLQMECTAQQALIKDKRFPNLSMLAASQTKDKESLTIAGVEHVLATLAKSFDYVILDSPAGIESGAKHAMYFADAAIIVTNPELSSCRDADKMIGFINARSRRSEVNAKPVEQTLLITRYDPERADCGESLSIQDIQELLGLDLVGVIPESKAILTCTNLGTPVITLGDSDKAAGAYSDMVDRFCGETDVEWRYTTVEPASFFSRLTGVFRK
jgi:septum site-determining protein MinD